jgi:hypothetical protein
MLCLYCGERELYRLDAMTTTFYDKAPAIPLTEAETVLRERLTRLHGNQK